jgi:lipoprotein-anchoring transpeptidase ErfK/SrfK
VLALLALVALSAAVGQASLDREIAEFVPVGSPDERSTVESLFTAVCNGDLPTVEELLNTGANPNAVLPQPVPLGIAERFSGTNLAYYVTVEPGMSPLMLASAMGHLEIVNLLLARGADPYQKTKRNKTFALWLAAKYSHIDIMKVLMGITPDSEAERVRIRVDLDEQVAYVWKDGRVEKAVKISSGRKKFPTPTGRYLVTNKYRQWKSTIYRASMPYFMRLSCGDFGLHAGHLPGYPASHGCIRVGAKDAKDLFAMVPIGALVEIEAGASGEPRD